MLLYSDMLQARKVERCKRALNLSVATAKSVPESGAVFHEVTEFS